VREAVGLELPLRTFFETRTVAGLAAVADEAGGGGPDLEPDLEPAVPPLVAVRRDGELPLSFSQQRLWLLDQLAPGNPFYNLAGALRLSGRLDVAALERALTEVVRRHEVLRTGFTSVEGRPALRIEPALGCALPGIDLRGLPSGAGQAEARRLAAEEARRPFDLGRPPLLRSALVRLGSDEHVLLITLHHIVSDGWSLNVLGGEMARLYAVFAGGAAGAAGAAGEPSLPPLPALPALPVQYVDFAVWQRSWLRGAALDRQLPTGGSGCRERRRWSFPPTVRVRRCRASAARHAACVGMATSWPACGGSAINPITTVSGRAPLVMAPPNTR
jgi:hypothetical protein